MLQVLQTVEEEDLVRSKSSNNECFRERKRVVEEPLVLRIAKIFFFSDNSREGRITSENKVVKSGHRYILLHESQLDQSCHTLSLDS